MQLALEQICERRQLEDEMIHQVVVPLLQQTSGTVYTLLGERVIEGTLVRQSGFSDLRYENYFFWTFQRFRTFQFVNVDYSIRILLRVGPA